MGVRGEVSRVFLGRTSERVAICGHRHRRLPLSANAARTYARHRHQATKTNAQYRRGKDQLRKWAESIGRKQNTGCVLSLIPRPALKKFYILAWLSGTYGVGAEQSIRGLAPHLRFCVVVGACRAPPETTFVGGEILWIKTTRDNLGLPLPLGA